MDPCPFLRILVGNLALKPPPSADPSACFCRIKIKNFPPQQAPIPSLSRDTHLNSPSTAALAAVFSLDNSRLEQLAASQKCAVKVEIYRGKGSSLSCGLGGGKLLGKVSVPLDLTKAGESKGGWIDFGKKGSGWQVHLSVRTEQDPRFVFRFEKEPECSPQVYQVQGSVKQPFFTCKFSFRNNGADRNLRSR